MYQAQEQVDEALKEQVNSANILKEINFAVSLGFPELLSDENMWITEDAIVNYFNLRNAISDQADATSCLRLHTWT